jgi:CheY-like chemotaxis protein
MFGDNGHGALGGRVLVVEDDADLREVMAGALAGDGHQVVEAADGRAALDALAAQSFDLVLLDVGLGPGPDGVEVCRRLRAPARPRTWSLSPPATARPTRCSRSRPAPTTT